MILIIWFLLLSFCCCCCCSCHLLVIGNIFELCLLFLDVVSVAPPACHCCHPYCYYYHCLPSDAVVLSLTLKECKNTLYASHGQSQNHGFGLRGLATILSISRDTCSDSIANSFVLVLMEYRTIIARYVAKWGIAQMCLCQTKYQVGVSHHFGGVLISLKKVSRDIGYRSDSIAISRDMGPLRLWLLVSNSLFLPISNEKVVLVSEVILVFGFNFGPREGLGACLPL